MLDCGGRRRRQLPTAAKYFSCTEPMYRAVAFARQIAMYISHVWLGLSLTDVGRYFGRDRTTVAHACHIVEERRENPNIERMLSSIETAVGLWLENGRCLGDDE